MTSIPDLASSGIGAGLSDGIANDWELAHSLNPLSDDSAENPDSDEYDNGFEYVADTDPQDENSRQTFLIGIDPETGLPASRFSTSASRYYAVQFRNDLTSGDWTDLGAVFRGSGTEMTVPASSTGPQRYYRLRIKLP